MKIVFIKVNMMYSKGKDALKPLIFPIIEELTPPEWEITFIDDRIETIPDVIDADIIALSVETFAAKRAYELAKKYKTEHNRIVMGGFHPSAMPKEAQEYADTVLIGDAEDTWPQYLTDVVNSCEQSIYSSMNRCPLMHMHGQSMCFQGKKYLKLGMVQASRGCKFQCDFCSIKSLYPGGVRLKEIPDIVEEIRNCREKMIFFIDDNLFLDEVSAKKLFLAIKPLKKKWACQISLEIAFRDEILTLMREAGCFMVLIGFESLNEDNLRQMNKAANLKIKDRYEAAIQNIYKHGLMIYGMFVLGYDFDTADAIQETYDFAVKNHFAIANFNPLMILPGTKLYERMQAEERLIYKKWWLDERYCYGDAMYRPKSMTPDELKEGCRNARFHFNQGSNIWKRMWGSRVNHRNLFRVIVFLAINLVSRAEIHRKQGEHLGRNGEKSE